MVPKAFPAMNGQMLSNLTIQTLKIIAAAGLNLQVALAVPTNKADLGSAF
jgi:hypothetical protein